MERKIPETELLSLTEIPDGLDVKEWIALHSKLPSPLPFIIPNKLY